MERRRAVRRGRGRRGADAVADSHEQPLLFRLGHRDRNVRGVFLRGAGTSQLRPGQAGEPGAGVRELPTRRRVRSREPGTALWPPSLRPGGGSHWTGLPFAGGSPRAGADPPGHQAGERLPLPLRSRDGFREGAGFRPRQDPAEDGAGGAERHPSGRGRRDAELYGPRANHGGPAGGRALRYLRRGVRGILAADRQARLRGPDPGPGDGPPLGEASRAAIGAHAAADRAVIRRRSARLSRKGPGTPPAERRRPGRAIGILQRRVVRSEEHTSELQSRLHLACRLLLEKKKDNPRVNQSVVLIFFLMIRRTPSSTLFPYTTLFRSEASRAAIGAHAAADRAVIRRRSARLSRKGPGTPPAERRRPGRAIGILQRRVV